MSSKSTSLGEVLPLLKAVGEKVGDADGRVALDSALRLIKTIMERETQQQQPPPAVSSPQVQVVISSGVSSSITPSTLSRLQSCLDFSRSWLGSFIATSATLWLFKGINEATDDPSKLLILPGSFGALATIIYALPLMPTAQPWPIFHCHTLGLSVSILLSFLYRYVLAIPRGSLTWLEVGLSVATATKLTSHAATTGGVLHPLAGGVAFFVANYANSDEYSHQGLGYLVLSVYIGVAVFVVAAVITSNVDFLKSAAAGERKKYPQDTIPEGGWGRSLVTKISKFGASRKSVTDLTKGG